jgi:hypothetical protein
MDATYILMEAIRVLMSHKRKNRAGQNFLQQAAANERGEISKKDMTTPATS